MPEPKAAPASEVRLLNLESTPLPDYKTVTFRMEPFDEESLGLAALIRSDAEAWRRIGFAQRSAGAMLYVRLWLGYAGFRATVVHRAAHWAHSRRLRGAPSLLHAINLALHGIEITPTTPIGPGLYLAHPTGTVITAASIGANVELQGGITIGMRRGDGFPEIEHDVIVGCGARILGPVVVGSGARVGANAVVVHSVEPGVTVVGAPARPHRKPDRLQRTAVSLGTVKANHHSTWCHRDVVG